MNKDELKRQWRLFWGIAPEHSLKSRKGYDIEDFWLSKLDAYESSLLERTTQWRDYFDDIEVDAKIFGGKIWKEKPEWLGMIQGIESVAGMAKYSVDKFINLIKEGKE